MLRNIMLIFSELQKVRRDATCLVPFFSSDLDLPVGSELLQMLRIHGLSGERVLLLSLKNDLICF